MEIKYIYRNFIRRWPMGFSRLTQKHLDLDDANVIRTENWPQTPANKMVVKTKYPKRYLLVVKND